MSALNSPLVTGAVTGLLGIFGGGTVVAFLKFPSDRNQLVVAAAQGAVVIQSNVLQDLRCELDRALEKIEEQTYEINLLRSRVQELETKS